MSINEHINAEMVQAAKSKDKETLTALRLIKAALHNKEIDLRRDLEETDVLQVLSSLIKQRRDSIEQFEKGGRQDLVEKEEKEVVVIQRFMPEQMTEEHVAREIEKAIDAVGAAGIRDMGKVMQTVMPAVTGRFDGKRVSEMVKTRLLS